MITSWFKVNLLISLLLLSALGYQGYQIYEDWTAQDGKVAYFLKNTEIAQRRQLKDLPETAIPFYGDSLVHGLAVRRASSLLENFGIGHDHSANLLNRVREDLQYRKFSGYAIAIGINDLGRRVEIGGLYNNIVAAVDALTFADTVYVHTVLPLAASRAGAQNINRKVRQINELLSELPASHENVVIVDTYGALTAHGSLPESFHIGDGLHLNSAANRKWAELLSTEMMR